MLETRSWAAYDHATPLRPYTFNRREPGARDVHVEILYCGVCHSDIHQARNEWANAQYPMVPGHEIVGRVVRVGDGVTRHKKGDLVGVGCFVGSCRTCASCRRGDEQYCDGAIMTYNGFERDGKTLTQGGYSTQIVVDEDFVLRLGAFEGTGVSYDRIAPLLCAGITTWSPLRHWKVEAGQRVGVVGLGGLGHMAVKLAAALGAEVTLVSTSPGKRADAARLGAHEFLLSSDDNAVAAAGGRFDLVINTVSAVHDIGRLLNLVRPDGTMVLVGAASQPLPLGAFPLIMRRRALAGSLVGGIAETQEMLDFCAARGIGSEVEVIPIQEINSAYDRVLKSDVRYRFVIDIASLR